MTYCSEADESESSVDDENIEEEEGERVDTSDNAESDEDAVEAEGGSGADGEDGEGECSDEEVLVEDSDQDEEDDEPVLLSITYVPFPSYLLKRQCSPVLTQYIEEGDTREGGGI